MSIEEDKNKDHRYYHCQECAQIKLKNNKSPENGRIQ